MQDSSGTIENEELAGFLKDLLSLAKKVPKIYIFYLQFFHFSQSIQKIKKNSSKDDNFAKLYKLVISATGFI